MKYHSYPQLQYTYLFIVQQSANIIKILTVVPIFYEKI